MKKGSLKLNSIQVLRFVAVALVVFMHSLFHVINLHAASEELVSQKFQRFGVIGVDIFFVISGFIISYIASHLNGIKEAKLFFIRRLIRIIPLYYLCSLPEFIYYVREKNLSAGVLFNSIFIFPVYNTAVYPYLLVIAWTLAYELLFYIIFALAITNAFVRKTILTIIILTSLSLAGYFFYPAQIQLNFITNPVLLEFVLGLLIGVMYKKKRLLRKKAVLICFTFTIAIIVTVIEFKSTLFEGFMKSLSPSEDLEHFIFVAIPCFFLVLCFISFEKNSQVKFLYNNKFLVMLGNASYSIYLTHLYGIIIALKIIKMYAATMNMPVQIFFTFCFGIGTGLIVHLIIEKPLLYYSYSLLNRFKSVKRF